MKKMFIIVFLCIFCLINYVYGNESNGKIKGLMEIYKEGFDEGHKKGFEKGYYDGYRQAVEDFKKMFQEKLVEYQALEAGKFLLKNWYISYPKVYQVTTDKGVELIVEGCSVMRPFDDLVEKIYSKIPVLPKTTQTEVKRFSGLNNVTITTEKDVAMQVTRKVSKKYIQDIQKSNLKYISPVEQDYVVVFFDSEKSAEKFCIMYGCEK